MNLEEKKIVSRHLNEEIIRLGITTVTVAEWLGIQPSYVSMAKNPAHFDSMSKYAWDRLEQWHLSREPLDKYEAPEKRKTNKISSADPPNALIDPPDPVAPGKQLKPSRQLVS